MNDLNGGELAMSEYFTFICPSPILNQQEKTDLDRLTERYNKLIEPSLLAKLGKKAGSLIPPPAKEFGKNLGSTLSQAELYRQTIKIIENGFQVIVAQTTKFSIGEKEILSKINQTKTINSIHQLDAICLMRSYDLAKLVNQYRSQNIAAAFTEGGVTGAFGFGGLPFNLVLSTFLYFRAVQSIAMFYGYDVKNDHTELVIASEVFTNALSPTQNDVNNEASCLIGKIMAMSQAAVVRQTAKKTWADMAAHGGIPLLLTQIRALANKTVQKALEKVGAKGLENSLFREAFTQIGKKLTLKTIGKAIPVASAAISALMDTAQMNQVLEYTDIFYQKRFILEKETRIKTLIQKNSETLIEAEPIRITDAP